MEKRYTEDEVRKIIKSATQIQNEDLESDIIKRDGISLEELEKISQEVGLKREYLRAAAFKYDKQDVKKYSDTNQTHIYEERDIAIEIDEHAWEELVSELRHHFGTAYGKVSEDIRRLEWSHMSMAGIETKASITNRGDNTRLRLSQRVGLASPIAEGAMYGAFLTFIFGAIFTAGFEFGPLVTIVASVIFFAISSVTVHALDVIWRKKKHKNLEKLADKLVEQLVGSGKTNAKKKFKFKTDISSTHLDRTLENDLRPKNDDSSERSGMKNGRSRV